MAESDPRLVSSLLSAPSPLLRTSTRSRYVQRLQESTQQSFVLPEQLSEITAMDSPQRVPRMNSSNYSTLAYPARDESFYSVMLLPNETVFDNSVLGYETFLHDDNPGCKASATLYQQFHEAYKNFPSEQQVFELVSMYEKICSESITLLRTLSRKTIEGKVYPIEKIDEELRKERHTWRLVRTLFYDRINCEADEDLDDVLMDTLGKRISEKQIVELLYERNASVRQMQLVVDWLEKNASEDFEEFGFVEDILSGIGKAWENTLHHLQNQQKNIHTRNDTRSSRLISEMDPDAPHRQDRSLHDVDQEDENKLLKFMFMYLRAGQLDEAQKLADSYGHLWLAAALEGWRLFHDPNFDIAQGIEQDIHATDGNKFRDIWKVAAWEAANEPKLPVYERALYAALCGNLSGLLSICPSWSDQLWAHLRVLLDVRIEQVLRDSALSRCELDDYSEPLPGVYWKQVPSLEQIFRNLEANANESLQAQSKMPFFVIQKCIILNDIAGLIEEMYAWIRMHPCLPHHLVRFMAHLVLFLRTIGWAGKEELCVTILESYVKVLIEERCISLVATYTAVLPPSQQVTWYAKFLEKIVDDKEQKLCLSHAKEAGLNVPLITKQVVENIRRSQPIESCPSLQLSEETTEEDKQKINALDWLIYEVSQRSEAVRQANALMRMFVLSGKLDAARAVFAKIPTDSIDIMVKRWKRHSDSIELPPDDDNTAREYFCFQAYLQAHNAFQDWFEHYHTGKPLEPEQPVGNKLKFTQLVAYEAQMKQYEEDLRQWEHSLDVQTKNTVRLMYNVLLFVDGGWMVDQRTEGEIDDDRQRQLCLLRKKCLPEMCFLLHSVLHASHRYKECLQLADVVASNKNCLHKEFSKHQLQDFLAKLRESSLCLLDENMDPLGYPIL